MLNADQLQLLTLAMAAGTFLVSLIMLSVLLRRSRSAQAGETAGTGIAQSNRKPASSAVEEQQLVAVITAAITAAQADEGGDQHLAAAIAAAVTANRSASGSTAGFVIHKIRRV
jgi:hypothetical protein